jgi:hypothetical protein
MWYDSPMPNELPVGALEQAEAAVAYAQQVRRYHRRRKINAETRHRELEVARERLKEAMKPLRTEIGRFPYGAQTVTAEENREKIRQASKAIQAERRKLTKMMNAKVSQ